ncbi:MAG: Ig-like domain-containing domain [Cruoricaptor ignavus]|nr:Ig-like domain-containing domain [Cruoricaptor ignavus]
MKKLLFGLIFGVMLVSCARVGSPIGGKKDTIAPKFVSANIDSSRVNVPTNIGELKIYFDEYVNLKDIQKNLIISPPINLTKILPTSLANKYILLQWKEPLKDSTTYSFNFGNSIVDLNEGNPLPYYNFAFSTGDKIDDLFISGDVFNGMEKRPTDNTTTTNTNDKKNYVVGLYQEKDSIDYRKKPNYITKADADGYFELNYLSPGKYRILAFDDENQNSVFDEGKENVAFLKEPIDLQKSISGKEMKIFPTKKTLKYKEMKSQVGGAMMIFEGNPMTVNVESLSEKLQDYKVTHKPKSDTVNIWFDAAKQNIGLANSENLKFAYEADDKKGEASLFYREPAQNEMTISNARGNLVPPKKPFEITANLPIEKIQPEKWTLNIDSLTTQHFSAKISEDNPYKILVSSEFEPGKKYSLTVPKETVSSYYKSIEKSYQFNFEIDKEENYGSFSLEILNAPDVPFWVQFLDEKGEVQFSKKTTESKLYFTELKPAKYNLRILVDNNNNGFWDEADFQTLTFAEDVYFFPKTIEIRPLWENKETWDLKTDSTETPILEMNENLTEKEETK